MPIDFELHGSPGGAWFIYFNHYFRRRAKSKGFKSETRQADFIRKEERGALIMVVVVVRERSRNGSRTAVTQCCLSFQGVVVQISSSIFKEA